MEPIQPIQPNKVAGAGNSGYQSISSMITPPKNAPLFDPNAPQIKVQEAASARVLPTGTINIGQVKGTDGYNHELFPNGLDGSGGSGGSGDERSGWGLAYGEDPGGLSAWGDAQQKSLGMQTQSAYDNLAQGSASQLGTGMSSLARSGGINSGARERMANQSAYSNMMGNQQIGMKSAQMGQKIAADDYTGRVKRGTYEDQMAAGNDMAAAMAMQGGGGGGGLLSNVMSIPGQLLEGVFG